MTDTVTSRTLLNTPNKLIVQLTNVSDGTGESQVIKVDKSTFTGPNGAEPTHLAIEKIVYDVSSMLVTLEWDHTTDETIAILQGDGCLDYFKNGKHARLVDVETGGTGDILLTTANASVGDGYEITLYIRKKD